MNESALELRLKRLYWNETLKISLNIKKQKIIWVLKIIYLGKNGKNVIEPFFYILIYLNETMYFKCTKNIKCY